MDKNKENRSVYNKAYRLAHHEKLLMYCRKWQSEHREQARADCRAWYAAHKEEQDRKAREYRISHTAERKEHDRGYRLSRIERDREVRKKYYLSHLPLKRKSSKKWRLAHPEYIKQWRETPSAKSLKKKYQAIRRQFGFTPLNQFFEGAEAHHIDKSRVIFIPAEIHKGNRHSLLRNRNMEKINKLAFEFMEAQ